MQSANLIKTDYNGVTVDITDSPSFEPSRFELDQNYLNSFNPATTIIEYTLPKFSHVELKVFDILGK